MPRRVRDNWDYDLAAVERAGVLGIERVSLGEAAQTATVQLGGDLGGRADRGVVGPRLPSILTETKKGTAPVPFFV